MQLIIVSIWPVSMEPKQTRRMTKQRQVILEELRKLYSHPTVDELHQIVRKRLPKISIATVYRNLEILCEEGLAQKMDTPGTQRRFDGNVRNHYHIRCCSCGRVDDVDLEPIPMIEEAIKERCDYAVMSHRLEFIGICSQCAEEERQGLAS